MFKRGLRPRQGPPFLFAFIWLVYMLFPINAMLQQPLNEKLIGLTLIVIFAVIYVLGFARSTGRFLSVLGQLAIVCYFAYRYDENFLFMAFYPSPLIGMLTGRKQTAAAFAALLSLFILIGWHWGLLHDGNELLQLLPALAVMLFLPMAMRLGRRSAELRSKLELANEEISRLSKNEERQRISRDLHDTLGHTLSLITLKSELTEKLIGKHPERAIQEVKDIQATSRAALKQVRELVSGMNAVTVRDEITHAKQILAAADMNLVLRGSFDQTLTSAEPLIDNILGMCLREAVTNTVKHSKARRCVVDWEETLDHFILSVSDDGTGADPAMCTHDAAKNGVNGMRERLKLVQGELTFNPVKGGGTRVAFRVPRITKTTGSEGKSG